jgi:regulatory protein
MRKITAIEPQKNNSHRVNIYLDGEFSFGLSRFTAGWLTVGQELSEEKIITIQADDDIEKCYQKAIHYLSYRPRSSMEVRKNLARRGVPQNIIEKTMDRLEKTGLVNDYEFARLWVENRNTFQPRSISFLQMELRRKGLNEEAIQAALAEKQEDEEELVSRAAHNYAHRLEGYTWPEFRKKLTGYLTRRGFSYSTISSIVVKVWNEIHNSDDG